MKPPIGSYLRITKFRNSSGVWGARVVAHGEGSPLNGTWIKVLFGPPVLFNGFHSKATDFNYAVLGYGAEFTILANRGEFLALQAGHALGAIN